MANRVVIIGGGAAGIDVLELLIRGRRNDPKMEITLIKKEKEGFFSMCGLPFAMQGLYSMNALNIFEPEFYIDKGIDFRTLIEVKTIDLENRCIYINSNEKIQYDCLVIATGSKPLIPPIPGTNLEGVFTIGNSKDGELLG